jgi:hypothetical protein
MLLAPASAQWSTQSLSAPRTDLAAVTVGDLALFAGGLNGQVASAVVDIYDATTDTWTVATLSVPRSSLAATAVGPYALFAGGALSPTAETAVVDVLDTQTMTWSVASLKQARFLLAATTVGSKAIFAGGATGGIGNANAQPSAVVDIYDASVGPPSNPAAWSETTLSEARGMLAAVTAEDRVLFAGGFNGAAASATVDVYDDSTGQWHVTQLSQARAFRSSTSAAAVGSRAFIAGGETQPGVMTDVVDIYDAQTGAWDLAQLSSARGGLAATALGNMVFFAGGVRSGFVPSVKVDSLNAGTGQWASSAPLSQARAGLAAVTVGDQALFAGGTSGPGSPHAQVDVYEPVGLNYCVATANSTGCAASIYATGSKSIASNDLVLSSSCMPNGVFLFFHATNQVQVPFGDGFLCAGGSAVRILPPGFATGGLAEVSVDLPSVGITAPGLRNFQCWFRDPAAGGSGFSTSDALAITFLP